jgi:hypothetical protein
VLDSPLAIGQSERVVSQTNRHTPTIARGLLAVFFVLAGALSLGAGLVGLIAWSWGGFSLEVAVVFVLSVTLAGLGIVGYSRSLGGDHPWSLVFLCCVAMASSCVALAMLD